MAVDDHDVSPVGARADQVQGIQRGSGSQADQRMGRFKSMGVEDDGDAVGLSGRLQASRRQSVCTGTRTAVKEWWHCR
jgi:hypothetical protein